MKEGLIFEREKVGPASLYTRELLGRPAMPRQATGKCRTCEESGAGIVASGFHPIN